MNSHPRVELTCHEATLVSFPNCHRRNVGRFHVYRQLRNDRMLRKADQLSKGVIVRG